MAHLKLVLSALAIILLLFIATVALALSGEENSLLTRADEIEQEMEANSEEYQKIAPQARRNRERCELASTQETQLAKLNGANSAKRDELDYIRQILQNSTPADPKLPL